MERRKRQFRLLVAAIALPAALLSVLTLLLFRQDGELARRRSVDESRTAAEQARGFVDVQSAAGKGSTFSTRILFPSPEVPS